MVAAISGHLAAAENSVLEDQVQLQSFIVNWIFCFKPDVINEIGETGVKVLVDGIATFKYVTF